MPLSRRGFLGFAATLPVITALVPGRIADAATATKIKALAFDAFPIFDPRSVFALAEKLFPGRGVELSNTWRIRQFEYQWLRALSGHYADFWQATDDALVFAANALSLELSTQKREQLMAAYLELRAWPDVPAAIRALRSGGLRLAILSNATAEILDAGLRNSGLSDLFEHVLSTDARRTYKPDPRAYQMAIDAFGLAPEEIGFVAFAGWDVAGAKWFGYPTFWVNRLNVPMEELGVLPDATIPTLTELEAVLREQRGNGG